MQYNDDITRSVTISQMNFISNIWPSQYRFDHDQNVIISLLCAVCALIGVHCAVLFTIVSCSKMVFIVRAKLAFPLSRQYNVNVNSSKNNNYNNYKTINRTQAYHFCLNTFDWSTFLCSRSLWIVVYCYCVVLIWVFLVSPKNRQCATQCATLIQKTSSFPKPLLSM